MFTVKTAVHCFYLSPVGVTIEGLATDFLIDNIYVRFGDSVFRQVIGIPMGTNSAPLLADLFLHTFEYDFML